MARLKVELPEHFSFSTTLPIRITDLNYGNHVGNDKVLSLLHEARMQYLQHHGYTELNLEGLGLIMSEVAIEFKAELFYGDAVEVWVTAADFGRVGFTLFYKMQRKADGKLAALAQTGMVCFDYGAKKIAAIPVGVQARLQG